MQIFNNNARFGIHAMRIFAVLLFAAIMDVRPVCAEQIVPTHIIGLLQETKNIDETTISVNGGAGQFDVPDNDTQIFPFSNGGSFSFAETGISSNPNIFLRQNRHEFRFSTDGVNALTLAGDVPWTISLDITINAPNPTVRKAFAFSLYDSNTGSGGSNSNINITTNADPAGPGKGVNITPGQSSVFGGQFERQRVIGPCDTATGCGSADLNSTVGYVAGTQVSMTMVHIPSPDEGTTPSQLQYAYDDSSLNAPYTNVLQDFRNSPAIFADGYEMGFVILGVGIDTTPNDSYSVEIENIQLDIGTLDGDFDLDNDVDANDFLVWQRGLGVDFDETDLALWEANYGSNIGGQLSSVVGVPEPGAGMLLLLGLLTLLRGNQKQFRGVGFLPSQP